MCAGAADVAELLDTDAVIAAGSSRLAPPPAGISGRAAAGAAGQTPTKALTLTQKPVLGGKPAAAAPAAEWAVRGGVRDLDAEFERLRPNLAYQFPFELDRFQKEAVVHLEQVKRNCPAVRSKLSREAFHLCIWHKRSMRKMRCKRVRPCLQE